MMDTKTALLLVSALLLAATAAAQDAPADQPPTPEAPSAPAAPPPAAPAEETPAEEAPPAEPAPEPAPAPAPAASEPAPTDASATVDLGVSAEAAEVEEISASPASGESNEIVVTGSRVKRTSFQASAPVQVIDRKELEYSGATNLEDVVQHLTVSQGSGFSGGGTLADSGTVLVNLRGLGPGATLVLINGRRAVQSGAGIAFNYTDLSTIPLSVVERVEVLKAGASAIYGSDAIGGVVNVITRKDWNGLRVQVEGQSAEEFDYKEGTASVGYGAAGERARVTLGLSYHRRYELKLDDRDWSKGPPSDWEGYRTDEALKNELGTQNISILGHPGAFGAPLPVPDPACGSPGTDTAPTDLASVPGAMLCGWNYRAFSSLSGDLERVSSYGHGEYDLTRHTSLFAEVNVARMRQDATVSPSFSIPKFPIVPAEHVDNPVGLDATFYGRPLGSEAGPALTLIGDDTVRTAIGIRGDLLDAAADTLLEDWEWELFATFGSGRYYNFFPDNIASRFQEALDSCDDPADLGNCFNPYSSALDGTGTPNSESAVRRFSGTMTNITDTFLQTYNAGLNGSLVELPGGDLGFALGGEVRHEARTSELDHDANELDLGFWLGNSDAAADREILAGYGELLFPVYDGVEIQAAGRVEDYSDVGTTANPTFGLLLTPSAMAGSEGVPGAFKRLSLRGHVAWAFKAPTLYQTFPGSATVPTQIEYMGSNNFVPVNYLGNSELDPEEAFVVGGGLTWNPVRPLTIDADYWNYTFKKQIVAEDAETVLATGDSAVLDRNPPVVPFEVSGGVLQRMTLTTINSSESTLTHGVDLGVMVKVDEEELGVDAGTFRVGVTGTYTFSYEIAQIRTSPLELDDGTRPERPSCDEQGEIPMAERTAQRLAGKRCDIVGTRGAVITNTPIPRLRFNVPVAWEHLGHLVVFTTHFTGPLEDDERYDPATGKFNEIDSMTTLDLQYGYTIDDWIGEALSLRVGVVNLLDTDPPFVDTAGAFIRVHDPRGRMFFAKVLGDF